MAKKRAIDIELATDRQAYLPGEAVTAFVRLDPQEDLEGVECSIALVHIDRYPIDDSSYADDRTTVRAVRAASGRIGVQASLRSVTAYRDQLYAAGAPPSHSPDRREWGRSR